MPTGTKVGFGGFLQPRYRLRQNSPVQGDQDGFRFERARLVATGETKLGALDVSAYFEVELQPNVDLFDAYVTVGHDLPSRGRVDVSLGQLRIPISRQQMLSDTRIAFVDKAQIATLLARRDFGARADVTIPALPQVKVLVGMLNGEGPNQVENINEKYLLTGRIEVTPFGAEGALAEGAFGSDFLTLAASVGHNEITAGDRNEKVTYLGYDIAFRWHGLSGTYEYLEARNDFTSTSVMLTDYDANGFHAALNYLLPIFVVPARSQLEVGARLEEIDRNDMVPISLAGDPEQSVRAITGVVSYYVLKHSLKAQLAYTRFDELEDRTASNQDATYANDQILLQVTYRLE